MGPRQEEVEARRQVVVCLKWWWKERVVLVLVLVLVHLPLLPPPHFSLPLPPATSSMAPPLGWWGALNWRGAG